MTSPTGGRNVIAITVTGKNDQAKRAFAETAAAGKKATGSISDSFAGLKGKLALAGAAAGVALLSGVNEALAQGADASKTAAQLGFSGEDAARFGRIGGKLYTENFAQSAAQGQQAIRAVMSGSILAEDSTDADIQKISEKALNLANVFDQDIDKSVRSVQQLIRTGLAKDATEAFDLMTRGFQQVGRAGSDDLLDTVIEYSTQFRELGISGPKAMGLISQAMKAGARDTDTVADAIKEFAIRSKDGSASSQAGFKAIGLNADTMFKTFAKGGPEADKAMKDVIQRLKAMKDPVAQDKAAVELFGTKAEDLQDALYALDPTTAVDAMGNVSGAADKMGKTLSDNAANDLAVFWREAKQKIVDFAAAHVVPALRSIANVIREDVVPKIQALVAWVKENQVWLLPLVAVVVQLAVAYKTFSIAQDLASKAMGVFNAVANANPVVRLLTIIGAIAAYLITAYQTSQTFRDIVNGVFRAVAGVVTGTWEAIKKAWGYVKEFFSAIIPGWIKEGFNSIVSAIAAPFKAAFEWAMKRAKEVWDTIQEIFTLGYVHTDTYNGGGGGTAVPSVPDRTNNGGANNKPRTRERATGGILGSGIFRVAERGREMMDGIVIGGAAGRRLHNNNETERALGQAPAAPPVVVISGAPGAGNELLNVILKFLRAEVRTTGRGSVDVLLGAV